MKRSSTSSPNDAVPCLARVLEARVSFRSQSFLRPLKLSTGTIHSITEAVASVTVDLGGVRSTGKGAIYLSDLWAWPDASRSHEERDGILRDICSTMAAEMPEWCGQSAHPLEHGLLLHSRCGAFVEVPALASAMCASPFDAALHDAVGLAMGKSAFRLYDEDMPVPSADRFFKGGSATAAVRRCVRKAPLEAVPGWYLVGGLDDLGDGFAEWAARFSRFKIKVAGREAMADAVRVSEVFRRARECGCGAPLLSLDSNEGNPDEASVGAFLDELERLDSEASRALAYLEQPTGRDISRAAFDWSRIARLKPVYLDEGLTSLDLLPLAKSQGWSGLALKTCKGHSFLLCSAAWAVENGLSLVLQDLTNPGLAALHSWLVAAHLPTENGIELNSPQFTPTANAGFLPALEPLFHPVDGIHRLGMPVPAGLGSRLEASRPH